MFGAFRAMFFGGKEERVVTRSGVLSGGVQTLGYDKCDRVFEFLINFFNNIKSIFLTELCKNISIIE